MRFALSTLLLLALTSTVSADPVSFKKDVAPVLLNNCLACHGPKKAEGGFRIDSFERLMKPGDSGGASFSAKDVNSSEAFRRITTTDVKERMPLEGDPLPAEQVAKIKQWIEEGAAYDAEDQRVPLASIVPPPVHPAAPESYARAVPITAIAFGPSGNELYVGGYHEITVWNPADGQLIRRITNIGQRVFAIQFSPDGQLIAVACGAPGRFGEVRLLKAADGSVANVVGMTSDVVFDAQFSPDGARLATAAADGAIRIFEVATGKEQLAITSHSDWVMAVAWSADGTKLASGSRDKTAKIFDAKTGDLVITFAGHNAPVKGVAFMPEDKEAYSAGSDNKVRRWNLAEAKQAGETAFGDEAYKLPTSGEFFFVASADKTVRQFNIKNQQEVRKFDGLTDSALAVAYHAATNRVAGAGFDGRVLVWNAADGKPIANFLAAPGNKP